MDIQNVVNEQLDLMIKDGKVEAIVRQHLEKTMNDVVSDLLRSYSDFGKKLKEEISKALEIDFTNIKAVDYNHIILTIVKECLDNQLEESVKQPIQEQIKSYLGGLEKKEWKLSEIIDKFIKEEMSDSEQSGEITLHVEETNYGSTHIYFDEEKGKRTYECEYELSLSKEGVPYSFQAGKYHPHHGDLRLKSLHGTFDKFFFRLYAQQVKIEVDEHACETEWYHE